MDIIKLNTARNCLRYIIKVYNIKELWVPYYICPAVRNAIVLEKSRLKFYHIDKNFFPTQEFKKDDFILYPNYFGISAKNVEKLSFIYKNLIVDNAHAFFMPHLGLASFSSLRKFFPLADGAYLYCTKILEEKFKKSKDREPPQSEKDFFTNEIFLDKENIKVLSSSTEQLISNIDFNLEKEKRLKKFFYYHQKLQQTNELKINLSKEDIPFVYPYITHNNAFIKGLKGLTILRYWNNLPSDFLEYTFYKYLIPIPL